MRSSHVWGSRSRRAAALGAAYLAGLSLLTACTITVSDGGGGGGGGGDVPAPEEELLITGPPVDLGTVTVGAEGGDIGIDDPASPLAGLGVRVPQGAYADSTVFRFAYEPILSHSLPAGLEPASPLIEIENGGAYAGACMGVIIPAEIPDGYVGIAFFYDRQSGTLEALPCMAQDKQTLWVATRHFTPVLAVKARVQTLDKVKVDTGFTPGVDTWQIQNWGSYLSGGGNCSGMSLCAMWYYENRKSGGEASLYGAYDAWLCGARWSTPTFDLDDSDAIRLCSVVQTNLTAIHDYENLLRSYSWEEDILTGDALTFYNIAASFKAYPRSPVYLTVRDSDDGSQHAVICYRIDGTTLYVADPNKSADATRTIIYTPGATFADGRFGPYQGVQSEWEELLGVGRAYEGIRFCGRTSIYNTVAIGRYWTDMTAGSIGEEEFPACQYLVLERSASGSVASTEVLDPQNPYHTDRSSLELALVGEFERRFHLYGPASLPNAVEHSSRVGTYESSVIDLNVGENVIGLHAEGKATWKEPYRDGNEIKERDRTGWRWVGFDWLRVIREDNGDQTGACTREGAAGSWRRAWDNDCDGSVDYEESEVRVLHADGTVSAADGTVLEGHGWSVGEDNYVSLWAGADFSTSDSATLSPDCSTMENGRYISYSVVGSIESSSCWTARRE